MPATDSAPGAGRRWPWFRDQCWCPHGWQDNPHPGRGPGSQGTTAGSLYTPNPRSRTATRVWTGLFAALLLLAASGVVFGEDALAVLMSALATLVLGAVFALALFTMLANQSRRIGWDSAGLADENFIAVRRVPWSAVHAFERENSAAARQRSHDAAWQAGSRSRDRSMRPRDVWVWVAKDAQGRPLLRLMEPDHDERHEPFTRLCERIRQHLQLQGLAPHEPVDGADEETELDDEQAALSREMDEAIAAHARSGRRIAGWTSAAVLLPFSLLTVYTVAQAAWWQWFAPRAEGRVAEHIVTGKDRGLTQLVVAWRGTDGQERRFKTSGTRGHAAHAVGAPMTVLYDPADPEGATLALFWEVWIWPVVAAVLLLIMTGAMALVSGAASSLMHRNRPPAG
jgi:hypothetical protein